MNGSFCVISRSFYFHHFSQSETFVLYHLSGLHSCRQRRTGRRCLSSPTAAYRTYLLQVSRHTGSYYLHLRPFTLPKRRGTSERCTHRRSRTGKSAFYLSAEASRTFINRTADSRFMRHPQEININIPQETAGTSKFHLSVTETGFGKRQITMFFRTGNGYIEQAAFLFQRTWRISYHAAREQVFFHTNHKHVLKFQSLGGMDSHQSDLLPIICLIGILVGK